MGAANLDNTTVTDQSDVAPAGRILYNERMMQTTETTSGGVAMSTSGSDDVDTYGGVSFSAIYTICITMMVMFSFMI